LATKESNSAKTGEAPMKKIWATFLAALGLMCFAFAPASAQNWPQKPIRMIVPFPAGGGTDFVARMVADHLSKLLNQPIFVENRGGANGAVGLQALKQSDPDGYTLGFTSDTPLTVNPWLYKDLSYDPLKDFVPVASAVRLPGMLAANPSLPANSIAELIALAKALAVAEPKRMPEFPDWPAVAETVPGFEMAPWVGLIAPAGTPRAIVDRLTAATLAVMHDESIAKQFADQQLTVMALGPDRFEALIRSDSEKWGQLVKAAGIKMEE
jgi:tripartite-type tricarboxylate transporter receptor subunit TctC